MKATRLNPFVRNVEVEILLENFLISAVAAIVSVRVLLTITGFPQIGSGRLHFAHMLWGGFLMAAALTLLIIYLNREIKYISAVIGGIGFGLFIDELGKFITHDNNYFFQPAIAFIYVIFVLLFLLLREMEKHLTLTPKEYASNALEAIREVILHDLDEEEKRKALTFLAKSESNDKTVATLKMLIEEIKPIPTEKPGILTRLKSLSSNFYEKLTQKSWFAKAIIVFFVAVSAVNFFQAVANIGYSLNFFEWGWIGASILSAFFVFWGVYLIHEKHKEAYEKFKTAVLISIFLTQFFQFYKAQLAALAGLVFYILILGSLQYLISQESINKEK